MSVFMSTFTHRLKSESFILAQHNFQSVKCPWKSFMLSLEHYYSLKTKLCHCCTRFSHSSWVILNYRITYLKYFTFIFSHLHCPQTISCTLKTSVCENSCEVLSVLQFSPGRCKHLFIFAALSRSTLLCFLNIYQMSTVREKVGLPLFCLYE